MEILITCQRRYGVCSRLSAVHVYLPRYMYTDVVSRCDDSVMKEHRERKFHASTAERIHINIEEKPHDAMRGRDRCRMGNSRISIDGFAIFSQPLT